MEQNDFNIYTEERYKGQIKWYDSKASRSKQFYVIFQWATIILSATVPVLVIWLPEPYKWITAIIAVVLAIATAGLKTFKFHENWISYRTLAETLKKEKYFYDAGLDDYAKASDMNSLFVERVESLISRENSLWITTHRQKEKKGKD